MSWFRFAGTSRGGNNREGFWGRIFSRPRARSRKRGFNQRNGRLLRIDALESRCLLSVTPADLTAVIVNQTFGSDQTTSTAHSVASDDNGDFVVTWTRTAPVMVGTATYEVENVYARYFTDTVEQISLPGPGSSNNKGQYLPNGIATNFDGNSNTVGSFSLTYNDQTIEQISVSAGTAPTGDPSAGTADVKGTFTLWYDANGNGIIDPNELLTVNYDETAPSAAAQQIQTWLQSFKPVKGVSDGTHATVNAIDPGTFVVDFGAATEGLNQSSLLQYVSPSTPTLVSSQQSQQLAFNFPSGAASSGTFQLQVGSVVTGTIAFSTTLTTTASNMQTALVNAGFTGATVSSVSAANPYTFKVTFAQNEPPVQYVPALPVTFTNPASASAAAQTLTFDAQTSAAINGTFELQVGSVTTRAIPFTSGSPSTTASAMQTALRNAGFSGATVSSVSAANPYIFNVEFTTSEQPIEYVAVNGLPATVANSVADFNLSGYLPAVAITTLDRPFTVNNIPVSQTDPDQTAQVIENAFQQQVDSFSTGVAPFSFPPPGRVGDSEAPYTAPVYTNVGTTGAVSPTTGFDPTITVQPVVNADGTLSYTEFDVTFTGVSGATVEAPMVVTNAVDENGVAIGATTLSGDGVASGSTASQVEILKQSGNEFQVNPTQPTSIFTENTQPLNSDQPAVAMDGSGDFVIAWRGQVSQQVAPKDVTDIYFRRYEPVGVAASYTPGTYVPGTVISDLVTPSEATTDPAEYLAQSFTGVRVLTNPTVSEVQQLTFDSTAGPTISGTFELQLGSVVTGAITFVDSATSTMSANLTSTAANIQIALANAGFSGATVSPILPTALQPGSPTVFSFTVTFGGASMGVDEPPIQYVSTGLPVTFTQSDVTTDPYTVDANVNYTNPQYDPAVAMDIYGNFVVVWANQGADGSYFNNISMQRFNLQGSAVGNPITVDTDLTTIAFNPDVAMGSNDDVVVTWTETTDPAYLVDQNPIGSVYVRGFDAQSAPLWNPLLVSSGGLSTISMDGQDDFTVAWQQDTDIDVDNQTTQATGGAKPTVVNETSNGVYAAEYSLLNSAGKPLASPGTVRSTIRLNSASTNTSSQTVWPFDQTAADVGMDLNGDIVATYQGNGPDVSDNLDIPASFFQSYFASQQVQQLTFDFTAGVPSGGTFELQLGSIVTQPITFSTTAATTAANIQSALLTAGFGGVTVSGALSGSTYSFDVTFVTGIDEPSIKYVATTSTASWVALTFSETTTEQVMNQDLLPYFNPFLSGPLGGETGVASGSVLYQDFVGTIAEGAVDNYDNYNVDTAIDQVLFDAEYPQTVQGDTNPPATQEQLGRLRAILEDVAGLLRGDSNAVMLTQWAAGAQAATYSDDIVSTQRDGQDQRYYIVLPDNVEQGTFQLNITIGAGVTGTTTPQDLPTQAFTLTTSPILIPQEGGDTNPPSALGAGLVDSATTANNIATAIDAALGTVWPGANLASSGAVNVRELTQAEIDARDDSGTNAWQLPSSLLNSFSYTNFDPFTGLITGTETGIAGYDAAEANVADGLDYGYHVYELVFQGQAHDIPIQLTVAPGAVTEQWVPVSSTTNGTITSTWSLQAASPPVAYVGDYTGVQGSAQYNASVAITSAGSMVAAYTDQALQTNGKIPLDASGNQIDSNVYYEQLAESTDTAGPRVVGWTSGNGIDLINGGIGGNGTATGVNAQYFVLTFDEPLLDGDPATTADSVLNPANYQIYNNTGTLLSGVITHVDYGLSEQAQVAASDGTNPIPDNKWEVILTLDGNPSLAGNQPLPAGTYTLKVLNAIPASSTTSGQTGICDIYGTPLNLTGYDPTGSDFEGTITLSTSGNVAGNPGPPGVSATDSPINSVRAGQQIDEAVASSATGNYVVVWTSIINNQSNIVGELFTAGGVQIGSEFTVNSTASTSWGFPDVAMDEEGDFVVTWSGGGPGYNDQTDPSDVFARQFNAKGQPIAAQFEVDQYTSAVQDQSRVAMAPDGTFVITWTYSPISQSGESSANSAIYAREYSSGGAPIDNSTFQTQGNEFQVSAPSSNAQSLSDVAMDSNDDFVIVWESDLQASAGGYYGDYFYANGQSSGQLHLNSPSNSGGFSPAGDFDLWDTGPRVGMDAAGAFVMTWSAMGTSDYDVYAQQFAPGGSPSGGAFMVNDESSEVVNGTTIIPGSQLMPAVGVDSAGDFTIVWTSFGQDNAENDNPGTDDYGIYARMYNANGSNFYDTALGSYPLEYRVNATTVGNQVAPAISRNDADGNSIMAWVGPDTASGGSAIFLRIVDPPTPAAVRAATPSLSVSGLTVVDTGPATETAVTVTLSAASNTPITVNYATADGTAKAGTNFSATSGTLAFLPGQTSKIVFVPLAALTASGLPSQTFQVNLSSPINAVISSSTTTVTIVDAMPLAAVIPTISVGDVTLQVGSAATQAVFTVSLSTATSNTVSMAYGTADGTATYANNAYTPTWGTLTFSPGQISKTIAVPVTGMTTAGLANETFILNLANAVDGKIVRAPATATLVDVATTTTVFPTISVGDVTVQVGTAATQAVFTVNLSAATTNTVSMLYGTADGTATAGSGAYTPTWGTLTFSPGQTSKTVAVPVARSKAAGLANQTFILNLASAVNGKIVRAPATATLVDAIPTAPAPTTPAVPTVSVGDVTVQVGSAATQAVFTVTLSAASTSTVSMLYGTADGTAKAASGTYTPTWGTLTFSPGQTSKTVAVPVIAMTAVGLPNQTFILNLANAVNGKIVRSPATATLVDVATKATVFPTISVGNATVQVGTAATQAVFTVTLSAATTNTVTMAYGTADGTATAASGAYIPIWGTLTFSPGQTSKTIAVPVASLKTPGLAARTFILNLANAVNGKIVLAPATATLVDAVPV
jgi:hypothetical protein